MSIINLVIFQREVYDHQRISIYFTIISGIIMKFLSAKEILKDDNDKKLYKSYIWLIPLSVIIFILATFLKSYVYCKAKYFFDVKYISIKKFHFWHGFFGIFINLILSIISTYIKCVKYKKFYNISSICKIYDKNISFKSAPKYYDNLKFFFKSLWTENNFWKNLLFLIFFLLKNILWVSIACVSFLITKYLTPEHFVCANSIYYLFLEILRLIGYSISDEDDYNNNVYDIICELTSILGAAVYLELIELNFFNLNYYLKKNIRSRSFDDSLTYSIYDEIEEDENID